MNEYFAILLLALCPLRTMCQFNMTAYREMPPLYDFDDYDVCLDNPKPSHYCLVIGEIVPNDTSLLWQQIVNFSADIKRNYRHDYLYFGVCLERCKQLVDSLNSTEQNKLYTGEIKNTELSEFFDDINKRVYDPRKLNDKLINTCLNYDFTKEYDLQVRSYTQYCVSNNEPSTLDSSEIVFLIVLGTILVLVVLSSNYDLQLKRKQSAEMQGTEFYKQKLHTQQDTILTSFSLYRNYYRLNTLATNEFRFFEGFRFITTCLVIIGHFMLYMKGVPVLNTSFIEKQFHRMEINLLVNNTVIIQIFLAMSSFLHCTNFNRTMASKRPGLADWGHIILNRYLRIAPSLAFAILLNATILPRLQDGPFWRHIVEAEYVLCRETWWRNMLFINNFTMRKSCLHQTWYLAADFQLYIILTTVLIIIARFPNTRNYILGTGVLISFLTTGMVSYFLKLNGVHQESSGSYRYFFWTNGDTLYKGYVPFYMNFGGFVFGTIAALIYQKCKDEGINIKGKRIKLNILFFFIAFPLPILLLLSGDIFFRYDFIKPSIWVGIFAALHRNIWALMCCSLILLMCLKVGGIVYRICALKTFVPLARISFQAYFIHTVVIRCFIGYFRQPIYVNHLYYLMSFFASIFLSYILAFLLYLIIESPISTLINAAMKRTGKPTTKAVSPNQTIVATNNSNPEMRTA